MIGLAAVGLGVFLFYPLADRFRQFLVIALFYGIAISATLVLGEAVTVTTVRRHRLIYGRIRLWGSLTFICAVILTGKLYEHIGEAGIYRLLAAALVLLLLSCLGMPRPAVEASGQRIFRSRDLLRRPEFRFFLAFGGLISFSHSIYYTFGTIHWQSAGIPEGTIGLLWSVGVITEIVIMFFAGRLLNRLGTVNFMLIGGLAGLVRWSILAWTTDVRLIVLCQILHGGTFGTTHLGAHEFPRPGRPRPIGRHRAIPVRGPGQRGHRPGRAFVRFFLPAAGRPGLPVHGRRLGPGRSGPPWPWADSGMNGIRTLSVTT